MEKKYLFFDIDGTLTNRATGGLFQAQKKRYSDQKRTGILWQSQLEEHIIRQKSLQRQMVLKIWSAMEEMDW